jgi:hypothetical protein
VDISIRTNFKDIEKKLNRLVRQQIPFATAMATTELAKIVVDEEEKNFEKVLDRPTPFTKRSVGYKGARKDAPEAIVYLKDIAAEYLLPYEFGGKNKLNSKALIKPVDLSTNQYGNLSRRQLAQLKNRPDIFIGKVKTRKGQIINGVWQRPPKEGATGRKRTGRLVNTTGQLRLLIRFADAHQVTQHLGWHALAHRVVMQNYKAQFGRAMAYALASAR